MAKVSEMIGDYAEPRGLSGYSVPPELAQSTAVEMRSLLDAIYRFNCIVDTDAMLAAWDHLNAMERTAWSKCVQAMGRTAC